MKAMILACALATPLMSCHEEHSHEDDQFICDGDEDSLAPGTTKLGDAGNFRVTIVEAIPPVHYVQNNELIVKVSDAESNEVTGLSFDRIEPFTNKHDHGTPIVAQFEATSTDGEYRLYDINYVHRGPWRVELEMSAADVSDAMRWVFCIEELPGTPDAG